MSNDPILESYLGQRTRRSGEVVAELLYDDYEAWCAEEVQPLMARKHFREQMQAGGFVWDYNGRDRVVKDCSLLFPVAGEQTLSDPMLTCAACSRVLPANEEGLLPAHMQPRQLYRPDVPCEGSQTKGHPH